MYEEFGYPRLCGGTFLTLLLQRKTINIRTGKPNANSLYLRDLFALCEDIFLKEFKGRSASVTTSKYKSCESINTGFLNTLADNNIDNLKARVRNNYKNLMEDVQNYIDSYLIIDLEKPWLVYALLELIRDDKTIDKEYQFYCLPNGQAISKKELLELDDISVPALLIGVWYYIITEKISNLVGRETYLNWTDEASATNAERPFVSSIGKNYNHIINATFYEENEGNEETDCEEENEIFGGMYGIAPELTPENAGSLYFIDNRLLDDEDVGLFDDYLGALKGKYSTIKTLLYNDEPKPFYSFYVCNNLKKKIYTAEGKGSYRYSFISNADASLVASISRYIIISGTGGLGKSMMMRHLLLSAVDSFETSLRVPIMVTLKDYSAKVNLFDFIFEKAKIFGLNFKDEELVGMAKSGNFYFLLDGYDEIGSTEKTSFDIELDKFVDMYPDCVYILSSRPTMNFVALSRFSVLELCEFGLNEAIELISKLEFRPDEPSIKDNFIVELRNRLYRTHKEFAGNPLLLTIMLMTFERFADVPQKMHIFYREAYETLSTKHDATKGAYKRKLNTGLNADSFERYLAEFCARTYQKEKFEFSNRDIIQFFNALNEVKRNNPNFSHIAFRDDLVDNLCLLYKEGEMYHFTHRSFQEYFCASFFSKQKDKNLYQIGKFFNSRRGRFHSDQTFAMLYDMIPEKVEEYIFLPYLEELFKKCDAEKGYWTFLQDIYSYLYYFEGEVDGTYPNRALQYLYYFIVTTNRLECNDIAPGRLPFHEAFVTNRYAFYNHNWWDNEEDDDWELVDIEHIEECYIDTYGEPEIEGYNLELTISDILEDPEEYADFIEAMEDENFPLMREYNHVRQYYLYLKNEVVNKSVPSDDLFDLLD